jgi:Flp pilus assembly pilin Flp
MAFPSWTDRILSRLAEQRAQTMAEYAVVLGVITPALILALTVLSGSISPLIDRVVAFF